MKPNEITLKILDNMASKIDDMPMFRGIPITEFDDKEQLIKLCKVFANAYFEEQKKHFEHLKHEFDFLSKL